ncbi:hypothetical protein BDV93DRAFT_259893 [Ceratobasidium sp. AG-I]|nr:hypothetical protein BDV93DRAFT_259893 [Ceratobasidium sp. AG-I]
MTLGSAIRDSSPPGVTSFSYWHRRLDMSIPRGILQSRFIAPCSRCFHFKCIRPLLMQHDPGVSCPLCRSFADLREDVKKEYAPSIYAPSVHESEGVAALVGTPAGNDAARESGFGPCPTVGEEWPAVPGGDSASVSGSRGGMSTPPSGCSRPLKAKHRRGTWDERSW